MKYNDIKNSFSKKNNDKIITFNDYQITVRQDLSSNEVYSIAKLVMEQSKEDGIYNRVLLELNLAINLMIFLTDIDFEVENIIDRFSLYDEIVSSGLYAAVAEAFPNFIAIKNTIYEMVMKKEEFDTSMAGILQSFIVDLPKQLESISDFLNNFNPDQYEAVKRFAEAANGGRPIS